ncbi:MAG: hypothetical protein ACMUIU_13140 [bacterium]
MPSYQSEGNLLEEIDRIKGTSWLILNTIEKYLRHAETLVLTGQEEKAFIKITRLRSLFNDFYQKNEDFIKDLLQENLNFKEAQL